MRTQIKGLFASLLVLSCLHFSCEDIQLPELGFNSFIGSYDFTVDIVETVYNPNGQMNDTNLISSTHLITIDSFSNTTILQANQLVIKNMEDNSGEEIIIDVTDDAFVISSPASFTGTGSKNGSEITIRYRQNDINRSIEGEGIATKR